jgi:hypothetical protein
LYEPFDYNGTGFPPLSGQVNTYVSPSRTWSKGGTTLDPQISDAGSLSYTGLPTGIGNSAFTSGVGATNPSSIARIGLGSDVTSVYYSLLIKVPADAAHMGGNGTAGSFFSGLQFVTSGTSNTSAATLLIRSHNGANTGAPPADVATTFDLGIAYRDTGTRLWDTNGTNGTPGVGSTDGPGFNPGDTIFLVVKYNSNLSLAGADSKDDSASIFIFNGSTIPASEPAAATVTSTNTGATNDYFYANDTTRTDTAVRTIHLRNNGSEPSNIQLDELRVGDSWAEVVAVPEPTALAALGLGAIGLLGRRCRRK